MIGVCKIGIAAYRGGGGGAAPNPDFVSTWDTTQAGSASDTVVLPLLSGGTYDGTIDWGDGSTSVLSYANRSHTYASGGVKVITISGQIEGWQFASAGDKAKIIDISNWGTFNFTNTRAFHGCSNMDITATDTPLITATDFSSNFNGCSSITSATDWSDWDTSTITSFFQCFTSSTFNAKVDNWVHSSVTRVDKMFLNASSFNQNLNTWDVSGVTNWLEFARSATLFNGSVSSWVPSGDMSSAFLLAPAFEGNGCETWDVSGVTNASRLFSQTAFSADISSWNTALITDMQIMLRNCDSFDIDISSWVISQVANFGNFMTDSTGFSTANYDALLIAWDAQGVMSYSGTVNFGGSTYTLGGAAEAARTSLISKWGGIIDGGGV
jgi:hypothetical protein